MSGPADDAAGPPPGDRPTTPEAPDVPGFRDPPGRPPYRLHDRGHRSSWASHRDWQRDPNQRPPWWPGQRPPWWPEDATWPPDGNVQWRRRRRGFFLRFAVGMALIFTLVVVVPVIVLAQVLSAVGLASPTGVLAGVVFLVLLLAVARTARGTRRSALSFGDLIEAAGRVEAGDYTARVAAPERGMRELRWLVEAFNSMAARLEADEQQRRGLLADVSHELRTPLAVLRGELEAMIDGIHPADEAHLNAAVEQVGMVAQLVEDLRTLALAEAGTLPLHPEPTDMAVLAHEVAASFEGLAAAGKVTIAVEASAGLPLLDMDPLRIRQVVANLVANALRYAPAGSAVTIVARPEGGGVRVAVTDAGPGIDPALLPHVFERFTRSDDSRGSGLGMAIARRLVEAHGGTIRAEQPEEGGTRITFELPGPPSRE